MIRQIDVVTLQQLLTDGGETALLDCREVGLYGAGHILWAVNLPASAFELHVEQLLPSRHVRIVLVDDDPELTSWALAKLQNCGYGNLASLSGGTSGWEAAGYPIFSGQNVLSKTFGEYVEHELGTPAISAKKLGELIETNADLVVVDCRTPEEFAEFCVPSAINIPGSELVHRIKALVPDESTSIVVHCAGRTRSIIGAQSLRSAGIRNPVAALENGTMDWHMAGFPLELDATRPIPDATERSENWGRDAARRVAGHFGVEFVTPTTVRKWIAERAEKTLYMFDVGLQPHPPNAAPIVQHVLGSQLVQATDKYIAVRTARVVLFDPLQTRACMTAGWLKAMGFSNVTVAELSLTESADHLDLSAPATRLTPAQTKRELDCGELGLLIDDPNVVIVDLSNSFSYGKAHIPGAIWSDRFAVQSYLAGLDAKTTVVLVSEDGRLAHHVADDLHSALSRNDKVLKGGMSSWKAANMPVSASAPKYIAEPHDIYEALFHELRYFQHEGIEDEMRRYIDWEIALTGQLAKEFRNPFVSLAD
jgi:rhodanese-related sulfurtransferase